MIPQTHKFVEAITKHADYYSQKTQKNKRWSYLKRTLVVGILLAIVTLSCLVFFSNPSSAAEITLISKRPEYSYSNLTSPKKAPNNFSGLVHFPNTTLVISENTCKTMPQICTLDIPLTTKIQKSKTSLMVSNRQLVRKFEKVKRLGTQAYGHGIIIHFKDRSTGRHYVMKIYEPRTNRWYYQRITNLISTISNKDIIPPHINVNMMQKATMKVYLKSQRKNLYFLQNTIKSISHLIERGVTPHLVRPERILTVRAFLTPDWIQTFGHKNPKPYDFFVQNDLTDGNQALLISEWLPDGGELKSNQSQFSLEEHLIFHIQNRHTLDVMDSYRIVVNDNECHNRFFTPLSESHCFRGFNLKDFMYWKYQIHGIDFYLPRPLHLLKLGDYDDWYSIPLLTKKNHETSCPLNFESIAADVLANHCIPKASQNEVLSILERWTREPREIFATILDMGFDAI